MMNRRQLIKQMTGGIIGASILNLPGIQAVCAADNKTHSRPNIVFILCDDLGWGDLGCYGNKDIKTPNIDKLASQGLLFTNFYVNSPVCSPTRAGIMTGQFPSKLGIHYAMGEHNWNAQYCMPDYLDPKIPTVTKFFQKAGYKVRYDSTNAQY